MKKLSIISLVLLLSMAACQKEDTFLYHLRTEPFQTDAKVHLGDDYYALWDAGDSVFVLGANGTTSWGPVSAPYYDGGNRIGEYEIELSSPLQAGDMLLYCGPRGTGTCYVKDSLNRYYIQYEGQQYLTLQDGTQLITAPMAALYSSGNSITFRNLMALMKVTVTNNTSQALDLQSITLESSQSVLQGRFELATRNGALCLDTLPGACSRNVSLNFASGQATLSGGASQNFYIAVPPLAAGNTFSLHVRAKGHSDSHYYRCDKTSSATPALGASQMATGLVASNFTQVSFPLYGSGTADNPYQIASVQDLVNLSQMIYDGIGNSAHYKLMNDINCAGSNVIIGVATTSGALGDNMMFRGELDGNGHTLSNVFGSDDRPHAPYNDYPHRGLFGCVKDAYIHDLHISGSYTLAMPASHQQNVYHHAGIIAAESKGNTRFVNVTASGSITTTTSQCLKDLSVGGFVGRAVDNTTFTACTNQVAINVSSNRVIAGGFVGVHIGRLTMTSCVNTANITTSVSSGSTVICGTGGFAGKVQGGDSYQYEVTVDRCRNSGAIHGSSDKDLGVGGLFGVVTDGSDLQTDCLDPVTHVSNFVNTGAITAVSTNNDDAYAGGLVGDFDSDGWGSHDPWFYNCLNRGNIHSNGNDARSGGICGRTYDNDTRFVVCVNTGTITGANDPHNGYISGDEGTVVFVYNCPETTMRPAYGSEAYHIHGGASYNELDTGTSTTNEARTRTDKNQYTEWNASQWGTSTTAAGSKACLWTGSVTAGGANTLDIDF